MDHRACQHRGAFAKGSPTPPAGAQQAGCWAIRPAPSSEGAGEGLAMSTQAAFTDLGLKRARII